MITEVMATYTVHLTAAGFFPIHATVHAALAAIVEQQGHGRKCQNGFERAEMNTGRQNNLVRYSPQ